MRFLSGRRRCITSVKNPSRVENFRGENVVFSVRFRVSLLSSMARASPARETIRADIFRVMGIVIGGVITGGMRWVII